MMAGEVEMEFSAGDKVLVPSCMARVPRHRKLVLGRVLEAGVYEGLELVQVWQYNHEPKCMAGWFEPHELKHAESAARGVPTRWTGTLALTV